MRRSARQSLIGQLAVGVDTETAREARTAAKWRAADDIDLRRALAEHYRRLGDPAQAGRWGIVFPGWSQPHEIARLRLFLLNNADEGNFVRRFLDLGRKQPVPAEVVDLVDPAFAERAPKDDGGKILLGCAGGILTLFGVIAILWQTVSVLWRGFIGEPVETTLAEFALAGAAGATGVLISVPLWRWPPNHEKAADPEFVVRRALELLDERPAEGRPMLRSLARTTDDPRVRHALVDDARRRGHPADAGRWGCPLAGLTTPEEREAYAAVLLRKTGRDPYNRLVGLSAVGGDDPSPGDIADVLRRVGATPPGPPPASADVLPPRLRWWVVASLPLLVGAVAVVLSPASAQVISGLAVALAAAAWATVCLVAATVRDRARGHRTVFAACAVVLAATAAGFAITAV